MMWYCRFRYQPGVRAEDVRHRVLEQHDKGLTHPEKIRGWYNLAGGGAGFMLLETENPQELTEMLEPYMDVVNWDVHAVYELPYEQMIDHFRRQR
ncbi:MULTISPECIES: DUF3303 family protein [Actinomadura]|uniref:DUF3303 domain-containing protein n=1 Tax=Actinomadura miaoliensis TaxID=430685 RepID=A0ABP7WVH6_9ACTN